MEFIDVWLFKLINNWVARSPEAFYNALSLSEQSAWLLAACSIVSMWFLGNTEAELPQKGRLTRMESRRRVLLFFLALMISFVMARVLAKIFNRARPLVQVGLMHIPIPLTQWNDINSGLRLQGSFPSDHAAMFAVITTGIFTISSFAGGVALIVSLYYSALRIGIGFHWPSDILVGALIGVLITLILLGIKPRLHRVLDPLLIQVERFPAIVYPIFFIIMHDFAQKFDGLFTLLDSIVGHRLH